MYRTYASFTDNLTSSEFLLQLYICQDQRAAQCNSAWLRCVWILPEQRSTFCIMLTWHCDRVCFIHFSTSELSFSTDLMHLGFPNLLLAHVSLQDFIHSYEHKRKLLCSLCSFYFVNTVSLFFSVEMSKSLTICWPTTFWALQITFIL